MSQTPGKTQAVQFYLVNERFHIVDLPGYGYAKVSKEIKRSWGQLVRSYLDSAEALQMIFLLLDARRTPSEDDRLMHEWTRSAGIDERVVLTKSDKLSNSQLLRSRAAIATDLAIGADELIPCSTVTKKGIDHVRREIASRL